MAFGLALSNPFARRAAGPAWSGTAPSTAASTSTSASSGSPPASSCAEEAAATVGFAGLPRFPSTVHAGLSVIAPPAVSAIRVTAAPDKRKPQPCAGLGGLFLCLGGQPGTALETRGTEVGTELGRPREHPTAGSSAAAASSAAAGTAGGGPSATRAEEAQERLAEAVVHGDAAELQAALAEAQQAGVPLHAVRRGRDALLAVEASDVERRVDLAVEEAVESDDWWRLQAAMQVVVGSGFGESERVALLKEAMRTHQRRQEVLRGIRKAAAARDAQKLRTAIEAALLSHAKEPDVRRARDSLRALEARIAAQGVLREAVAGGGTDLAALEEALAGAERARLHEKAPEPLGQDPGEAVALEAARAELRSRALARMEALHAEADAEGLAAALLEVSRWGLGEAEVAKLEAKLEGLRALERCREQLREALGVGGRAGLAAAIGAAEEAGLGGSGGGERELQTTPDGRLLLEAREALRVFDEQAQHVSAKAMAAERLRSAASGDDVNRLAQALSAAESAGLSVDAEVCRARERLRLLRAQAGISQELQEAVHAGEVYRLRAAIAGARGMDLPDTERRAAQDALKALEAEARERRGLGSEPLRAATPGTRRTSLGKRQGALLQAELNALGQEPLLRELHAALAAADPSPERLRAAAQAAVDAGAAGAEVDAAWERLRFLESRSWLRRQLHAAVDSGEAVRIRAAIKQAEVAGACTASGRDPLVADLAAARAALGACSAREHARQELQLARASGNPAAKLAAVRAAREAGLPPHEFADVASACAGAAAAEKAAAPASPEPPAMGEGRPPSPRCPSALPCGSAVQQRVSPLRAATPPPGHAERMPRLLGSWSPRAASKGAEARPSKAQRRVHFDV